MTSLRLMVATALVALLAPACGSDDSTLFGDVPGGPQAGKAGAAGGAGSGQGGAKAGSGGGTAGHGGTAGQSGVSGSSGQGGGNISGSSGQGGDEPGGQGPGGEAGAAGAQGPGGSGAGGATAGTGPGGSGGAGGDGGAGPAGSGGASGAGPAGAGGAGGAAGAGTAGAGDVGGSAGVAGVAGTTSAGGTGDAGGAGGAAAGASGASGQAGSGPVSPCPEIDGRDVQYSEQTGHCYWLESSWLSKNDWSGRRDACKNRKGDLVAIGSAAENDFVRTLHKNDVWIGATDGKKAGQSGAGTYKWSNGDSLTFLAWAPGEPNAAKGGFGACPVGDINECYEHCAVQRSDGSWNDTFCNANNDAICELDPQK